MSSWLPGIALPLIQAPMAGVQGSALAVAVSNAGALGSLPCAMLDSGNLEAELALIAAQTERPYNVNFFCHASPSPDAHRDQAWRTALAPYYREAGIEPPTTPSANSRMPFNAEAAALLEAFRPPVVSFHFGLPEPALLARIRSWGGKILSSATTVAEARWLERQGADAVIAQGLEAGGHRGHFLSPDLSLQAGAFALLPQIVNAVGVPVIAAGGIADARGASAALALGASAVQIGTAYLLCPEVATPAVHRAALRAEPARHTVLTNVFTGRPARSLVNRLIRELGPISPLAPDFPLAAGALAPLRRHAEAMGRDDFSPLWAGQNTSGCRAIPAAELTLALLPP